MAKYVYPAIFTKEDSSYSVVFRALDGCYTCGDTLEDRCRCDSGLLALF